MKNTLEPDVVRKLLKGYPGIAGEIAEQDKKDRDSILAQRCKCGTNFQPRVAEDPFNRFDGTRIRYSKWCSRCRITTE